MSTAIRINGEARTLEVDFGETVLTTIRDRLGLTGAKRGCNQGVCGACTIEIDGVPMRGCLSLTAGCAERPIRTIEGFEGDRTMAALQDAFVALGGLQCGFCTTGMLISARALLVANANPSVADVQTALSGNLCRCTGYKKIVDAVIAAARTVRGA